MQLRTISIGKSKGKAFARTNGNARTIQRLIPENLLEDILRSRSLDRGLEDLGYPHFLVQLYRKALHSRGVMG